MPIAPNVTIIPAKMQTAENRDKYHQLRVAAYCRVSTEQEEQQNSYQVQIAYYTDLINRKKEWTLVGIFADEGISGTQTKKRTEFNRMIRMCKNKKIDLVITKSISRFARNTVDCLEYVRLLKDLGIGVIFEKESINTLTMTSEFMIALYGSFAQAESESISKNVSWGKEKAYREGRVQFQYKHLLGYKRGGNGEPAIVPEEAETIRLIFKLFLDGYSMKEIAVTLKNMGKLNKYGDAEWRSNTISRILQNEKYVGDALLQKTYITDCITKKSRKNNGELPMYLVKNHHEPIISRADFNRVQEEMARRGAKKAIANKLGKTEQGKYSAKYALSELLICGECGSHYRRVTWTAKGYKEIKWRCINRIQYGKKKCHDSPTVDEQALHRAIVSTINKFCEVRDDVAKVLRESITEVLDPNQNGSVRAAQQRIDELARNMDELIKLAALPETVATAMTDIERFSEEMKTLREFIETEKAKQAAANRGSDELNNVLQRLENEDFTLTEYDDVAVRQLIEKITVDSKDIITVTFKGGFEIRKDLNGD